MPTNDERREIAENLRTMTVCGCKYKEQFYELLEETVMPEWEFHSFDTVADRLADLIEPEPERTVNLTEAVDAICGEMCGDGWDWRNRAEAVVKTVAEICGAKVVEE